MRHECIQDGPGIPVSLGAMARNVVVGLDIVFPGGERVAAVFRCLGLCEEWTFDFEHGMPLDVIINTGGML